MKNKKISVVTVCYNSENTIGKTLDSLLNQTCKNFEHIIIDGGSTDNTLAIINRYIENSLHDVTVISEPDDGLYDAMNKGVKLSTGKFVSILSSDDWYELDVIEHIEKHVNLDVDIIYGYLRVIVNGKELMVRRGNLDLIDELDGKIQHPACFISREIYMSGGLYDTSYKVCADQDFFLRILRNGASTYPINKIITNFVKGGTSDNVDSFQEIIRYKTKYELITKKEAFLLSIKYNISKLIKKVLF